jgi:hypothetical protein
MSTRSVIAIPDESGWKGRYVHWDGYPRARGPMIEEYVAAHGYAGYLELLDSSPRGMSAFPSRDQDFAVERYEDGASGWITGCDASCSTCDPLFLEWVYVVHPDLQIEVRESQRIGRVGEGDFRHHEVYRGPISGAPWATIDRRGG